MLSTSLKIFNIIYLSVLFGCFFGNDGEIDEANNAIKHAENPIKENIETKTPEGSVNTEYKQKNTSPTYIDKEKFKTIHQISARIQKIIKNKINNKSKIIVILPGRSPIFLNAALTYNNKNPNIKYFNPAFSGKIDDFAEKNNIHADSVITPEKWKAYAEYLKKTRLNKSTLKDADHIFIIDHSVSGRGMKSFTELIEHIWLKEYKTNINNKITMIPIIHKNKFNNAWDKNYKKFKFVKLKINDEIQAKHCQSFIDLDSSLGVSYPSNKWLEKNYIDETIKTNQQNGDYQLHKNWLKDFK